MTKIGFFIVSVCALLLLPLPAMAQRVEQLPQPSAPSAISEQIAVVVNDSVITASDVESRYRMALVSSGLTDETDVRKRITPQVVQALIDEQIQLQEARRLEINISDAEIDQAIKRIAADNNVDGDMRVFLANAGVQPSALENQIRASLSWIRVVQRTLRPRIDIGDDEVDAVIERLRASSGKQEFLVSEIFIASDGTVDENQAGAFAAKLKEQIDQGKPFAALARQFSQGTGAMNGGDLGWVQQGQLPTEIDNVLKTMNKGDVAGPIKTANGFHLIAARDTRIISIGDPSEAAANLVQLTLAIKPPRDRAAAIAEATKIRSDINSCDGLREKLAASFADWRYQDMGKRRLTDLPEWLADLAKNQKIGEAGEAVPTGGGITVFYVCDRTAPSGVDRDMITNMIGMERLENLARRQLRDLKRTAYIEIRS
jgi:peptidyl-prolyl cis-trans isomerase SurA